MDWGENLSTKVFVQDSNVRSKFIAGSICWKLTQVWSPSWVFVKNWPKHKAAFFRCSWGSIFQLIPRMTRDQDSIQLGQRKHNSKWFYINNGGWFQERSPFLFSPIAHFQKTSLRTRSDKCEQISSDDRQLLGYVNVLSMCCQCAANVLSMYLGPGGSIFQRIGSTFVSPVQCHHVFQVDFPSISLTVMILARKQNQKIKIKWTRVKFSSGSKIRRQEISCWRSPLIRNTGLLLEHRLRRRKHVMHFWDGFLVWKLIKSTAINFGAQRTWANK